MNILYGVVFGINALACIANLVMGQYHFALISGMGAALMAYTWQRS